jgi:hypothetical protein
MFTQLSRRSAQLTAGSLCVALLLGCGGGGSDTPSPSSATADAVALTETATGFTVTAQGARGVRSWSAMQFAFTANVTSGTHAGSTVSGLLLLKGETDEASGSTQVEGKLLFGTLPSGIGSASAMQARSLIAAFRTQADVLRDSLRSQIDALRDQLSVDLAAAADDAARQAAKKTFGDAFKALIVSFQQDMLALVSTLRDALTALGLDPSRRLPGGGDGSLRGHGRGGFDVAGTIAADGRISGTVTLAADQVIRVTGEKQIDGSFKGRFTGPASDDAGDWTAAALSKLMPAPEPVPTPQPPASAAAM